MTGHALYPAIDKEQVSTYSKLFYDFIRRELKFEGIIIPDALNMGALSADIEMGEKIEKTFTAGADVVMLLFEAEDSIEYRLNLIKAIKKEHIAKFNERITPKKLKKTPEEDVGETSLREPAPEPAATEDGGPPPFREEFLVI
jgi:beta-N-acetylhexosaminidase